MDAVKVRVAAAKGLVGFDRRRKQKKQDKQDGVKRVVWLDEMDFNSEECVHRLLLPIPCSREGVCVCVRVLFLVGALRLRLFSKWPRLEPPTSLTRRPPKVLPQGNRQRLRHGRLSACERRRPSAPRLPRRLPSGLTRSLPRVAGRGSYDWSPKKPRRRCCFFVCRRRCHRRCYGRCHRRCRRGRRQRGPVVSVGSGPSPVAPGVADPSPHHDTLCLPHAVHDAVHDAVGHAFSPYRRATAAPIGASHVQAEPGTHQRAHAGAVERAHAAAAAQGVQG